MEDLSLVMREHFSVLLDDLSRYLLLASFLVTARLQHLIKRHLIKKNQTTQVAIACAKGLGC